MIYGLISSRISWSTPTVFVPESTASWAPPYHAETGPPLVLASATGHEKGFEQCRVYPGPDGLLHMLGNDHGDGNQPHYVATDATAMAWRFVGDVPGGFGEAPHEPTPVIPIGGVPGDRGGVPTHFIQFSGNPLAIDLMHANWTLQTSVSL
mmetsp:Transcript_61014/g.144182  ORF Transcript_61014/g.144182 Transcript_61014/m.144182 type:complete len:151 (+) Transcript_61014:492-944(+)